MSCHILSVCKQSVTLLTENIFVHTDMDRKLQSMKSQENANAWTYEPLHEISSNVVCATSKASDQPAHMRSLIRACASCMNIL